MTLRRRLALFAPPSAGGPPTSAALTGPTSGATGAASANFTVTLNAAADATVTITPTGTNGTVTFSPSTPAIAIGQTSVTFTATAALDGLHNVSISTSPALSVTGSPVAYTTSTTNAPPSWTGTPSAMSAKRGQALGAQNITSLVTDTDALTYTISGAPTGVTIGSSTGIISGTPTAAPGTYSCTVSADDGSNSPVASAAFNITVTQAALALSAAGYEFGDGNSPATMAVLASTSLQVAVYPMTEWPPAAAIASATATTGTNGRLPDLGDDDLVFGTTYRVLARNAADGQTWAWTMAAS